MFFKKLVSVTLSIFILANSFTIYAASDTFNNEVMLKIASKTNIDSLVAKGAILIDLYSGRVLHEKNKDTKLPLASVTKIMTSLLIMEALDSGKVTLDTMIEATPDAVAMGGSQVYLEEGEKFRLEDMLKAIFVHSANDACVAVADHLAGSESVFVAMMNNRAKELGMNNTNFLDSTGIADDKDINHYSSAQDIAIMSRELILKHPKSIEYSQIWMDTFRDGKFRLDNTNKLVKYYNGTTGLKTGYTELAGNCISVSAKRGDMHLIAVVLGEPDTNTRFAEARKLLDHGFANFKHSVLAKKGDDIGTVPVEEGNALTVKTSIREDFKSLIRAGEDKKVVTEKVLNQSVIAPVAVGTKVGELVFKINNSEIGKTDIVTTEEVSEISFMKRIFRKVMSWFGVSI